MESYLARAVRAPLKLRSLIAPNFKRALVTAIGGGVGIAIMIALAAQAGLPLSALPFTTSIVMVMASPDAPLAQPRNVLGGHLLSVLAGFVVLWSLGGGPSLAPIAVAVAIFAMQVSDTLHPPAAINALLVSVLQPGPSYILVPTVSGALILVAFALAYHRVTHDKPWPLHRAD